LGYWNVPPARTRRASQSRSDARDVPLRAEDRHAPARRVHQIAFALLLLGAALGPLSPTLEDNLPFRLIVQALLLLSGAVWVIALAMEDRLRVLRTQLGLVTALLLAALLLATVTATYRYPAALTFLSWATGVVAFIVVIHEARTPERRRLLFLTLGAVTLTVSLQGLHQALIELPRARAMFQADTAEVMKMLNLPPGMAYDFEGRLGRDTVFSTFLLATSFAGFLALTVPGLIGYLLDWRRARRITTPPGLFLIACALLAPALLALYLTKSKGGWAAFLIAMALFGAWSFRDALRKRRMQVACALLAGLVVLGIAQRTGLLPPLGDYAGSFMVRYKYWRAGVSIAEQHPVLGVGLDNFADYYAAAKHADDQEARRAHNDYIQLAAEAGLTGLTVYAIFWVAYWRRVRLRRRDTPLPDTEPVPLVRPAPAAVAALAAGVFIAENLCGGALWGGRDPLGLTWPLSLCVLWIAFMLVYGHTEDPAPVRADSCTCIGLVCGLVAFLVHGLTDFDHYVPGILQTAWIIMGLVYLCRTEDEKPEHVVDRPLGAGLRAALVVGVVALAIAFLYGFVLPVTEAQALRERALDFTNQRSIEQRESDLRGAIAANPFDAHLSALLSDLYANQWMADRRTTAAGVSTLSEAIVLARRAARLAPARSEYHARVGRLLEARWLAAGQQSDYAAALESFQRAEALFPSNPDAPLQVARLYDEGGRMEPALGKYLRAAQLSQEEQYHIIRKFSAEEMTELYRRIDDLRSAHTLRTAPPPLAFKSPRLTGWPGRR
jgi:O-antigen ligase